MSALQARQVDRNLTSIPVDRLESRRRSWSTRGTLASFPWNVKWENIDLGRQTQDRLARSAACEEDLLGYSGISVKMMIGGLAKEKLYPGGSTITTVNVGLVTMVRTFALALGLGGVKPTNPRLVEDSWFWADKPAVLDLRRSQTPTRQVITAANVADDTVLLLENPGMSGSNLDLVTVWFLPELTGVPRAPCRHL